MANSLKLNISCRGGRKVEVSPSTWGRVKFELLADLFEYMAISERRMPRYETSNLHQYSRGLVPCRR